MRTRIQFTVEKNRVLVPVGEPCPFGCRYCYTRGGEVGPGRVNPEDVLVRFEQFALEHSFETIQFGYDGDPFAHPKRGLDMLQQLALFQKHINFSTKAALDDATLASLYTLGRSMQKVETVLSGLVSLSCWESAAQVEPHTPTPAQRIQTVARLRQIGIPVFIALRPILPHIPDSEYERIVDEGIHAGCTGFIPGPLYADARGQFARFIPQETLQKVPAQTGRVPWSAHAPTWTRYEDGERLSRLMHMIQQKRGDTFLSSTDAIASLYKKECVA